MFLVCFLSEKKSWVLNHLLIGPSVPSVSLLQRFHNEPGPPATSCLRNFVPVSYWSKLTSDLPYRATLRLYRPQQACSLTGQLNLGAALGLSAVQTAHCLVQRRLFQIRPAAGTQDKQSEQRRSFFGAFQRRTSAGNRDVMYCDDVMYCNVILWSIVLNCAMIVRCIVLWYCDVLWCIVPW